MILIASPAMGNPVKSRFTTLELRTCSVIKRHSDGNTWRCSGLKGYPVSYAEGDLRAFVGFSARPEASQAMQQTLAAFNSIFKGTGRRATIEWRFRRQNGVDHPYAAIMRVFTSGDGQKGEVLIITKITATEACHMAYIDTKANADAMALARSTADELAAAWKCTNEPRVMGASGKAPI